MTKTCVWVQVLAQVLGLGAVLMAWAAEADPGSTEPQKRALLVAVGAYAPETGWETLASETDLELVSAALSHHGFEGSRIRSLRGAEATRVGILRAIEDHLLAPSRPGDALVLLLSGHGQRLTDGPDADELDGYDEAFVPWDAPKTSRGPYRGEKHLRDDELGQVLDRLRRKVGSTGEVLVLLDSCFSGTGTRGDAAMRGGPALGPPRGGAAAGKSEEGGGFREQGREARQQPARGLAPLIVLTAARSDESVFETETVDGRPVGPLSRAFARSLLAPGLDPTYRGLAEEIRWEMASYLLQHQPQAEGDLDRGLFGGRAVRAAPYLRVSSLGAERTRLTVRPGALIGLEVGAEVEVHAPGTVTPGSETRLAAGRVERATHAGATVLLSAPLESDRPTACRVFVTRYSFGDLQMRVELVEPSRAVSGKSSVTKRLGDVPTVQLVRDHPHFRVRREPAGEQWVIREAASGRVVARIPSDHPASDEELAERLRSLARSRYLRRVNHHDPRLHTDLEIVPVKVSHCPDPALPSLWDCTVVPVGAERGRDSVGLQGLPLGAYFQLRITPGELAAYVTVLDLMPDGQIEVLWPPRGQEELIYPGDSRLLPRLYRTVEPAGVDQLLLIASESYLDFHPFRSIRSQPGALRRGPFEPLFDDLPGRTRSRHVLIEPGQLSTTSRILRVLASKADAEPVRGCAAVARGVSSLLLRLGQDPARGREVGDELLRRGQHHALGCPDQLLHLQELDGDLKSKLMSGQMRQKSSYLAATMDSIQHVRTELANWHAATAVLWSYGVTHSVLTIRLQRQGAKGNLHVTCIEVVRLSGPVGGPGVSFIVEETTLPLRYGKRRRPALRLKDTGELGIVVICEEIVLDRNVRPLY